MFGLVYFGLVQLVFYGPNESVFGVSACVYSGLFHFRLVCPRLDLSGGLPHLVWSSPVWFVRICSALVEPVLVQFVWFDLT